MFCEINDYGDEVENSTKYLVELKDVSEFWWRRKRENEREREVGRVHGEKRKLDIYVILYKTHHEY